MSDWTECKSCDGTGAGARHDGKCTWCGGRGEVLTQVAIDRREYAADKRRERQLEQLRCEEAW